MPTADLRDLAARLGLLKPCPDHVQPCPDWCGRSEGVLPTEAEVREAIFEAGVHFVEVAVTDAGFAGVRFAGDEQWRSRVENEEVETGTSVLLALLRALEVARG